MGLPSMQSGILEMIRGAERIASCAVIGGWILLILVAMQIVTGSCPPYRCFGGHLWLTARCTACLCQ
ncbi:hypothetical protein XpopCFBP1817_17025 [Xanthomonas populi]|uniref:Uncharacterized protein n=1 Tax=Xanthomonas populi TaxID=53414 RepID=A0A2S7EH57_9XANT|nr:hypothetical protein XpopCFBP1817_17025 [Xanthomonas populi]